MLCLKADEAAGLSIDQVADRLRVDPASGLSRNEAESRLRFSGYNEFEVKSEESLVEKYVEQFKNPLILLLLASAAVSVCMQQFDDALSITIAVVIVVTVAFVQEYRSEKSLEALNKLVPPGCTCLRDGVTESFLARNLVPGDVILLMTGDRVPADVRIIHAIDLSIDESSFTGETEPVTKTTEATTVTGGGISCHRNMAFMGTLVQCGNGRAIVTSTGESSEFGALFQLMRGEESPKTPLQKSMDSLGQQLSFYSFGIIGFIMFIGWVQGKPLLSMFNIGVSLAVAAIPEGLPIVVTVTLALGVMRMAKRKAIIKKLPTVETLGCVNVVCSDKTGTLTRNEMTVTAVITSENFQAEISGVGYESRGQVSFHDSHDYNKQIASVHRLLEVACLCNNADVVDGVLRGQPTEGALLVAARKANLTAVRDNYTRLEEIPFSSEEKIMIVRCCPKYGPKEQIRFYAKGAIEKLLTRCNHFIADDAIQELRDDQKHVFLSQAQFLGRKGLRVLAMAYGVEANDLIYVGMVGIVDPPRDGAREAIRLLIGSGVNVKMVTGDAGETACAIAARVGLWAHGNLTLSGPEIDQMDDRTLQYQIPLVNVLYRVGPGHKLRIIKALQNNGQIVGMTGDGVNDAVALKKADIGIAMGRIGTDVSKEAADMILVDDDFYTIMAAIEEGKGIFHNIRNFVRFQLSTSIAALSLIAISTLKQYPNPLNAMQILWINIIMDGPPAQSLGVEPVDPDVLQQPPRNVKEPMISRDLIINVLMSSSIIIAGTLFIFIREVCLPHACICPSIA